LVVAISSDLRRTYCSCVEVTVIKVTSVTNPFTRVAASTPFGHQHEEVLVLIVASSNWISAVENLAKPFAAAKYKPCEAAFTCRDSAGVTITHVLISSYSLGAIRSSDLGILVRWCISGVANNDRFKQRQLR
jgi:hypothetical protein